MRTCSVSLWVKLTLLAVLFLPATLLASNGICPDAPVGMEQDYSCDAAKSLSTTEYFKQVMRDRISPTEMPGVTGSVQHPSRYGPKRNDPAQGVPRYAYSPFEEKNSTEVHCPSGGCDYMPGVALIKLAPEESFAKHRAMGEQFSEPELNRIIQEHALDIEPLFPDAVQPLVGTRVVRPDGKKVDVPDLTRWYKVKTTSKARNSEADKDVPAMVRELAATKGVVHAEPDYLRKPLGQHQGNTTEMTPRVQHSGTSSYTDPLYSQQWHLEAANVQQAWAHLESQGLPAGGSPDIVVAVIDTGVDYTHPDLVGNMWVNQVEYYGTPGIDDDANRYVDDIHGARVIAGSLSGDPMDDHGHGTHVAGIIAAQAGNGIGGVGVAPNVKIMAIKAAQYSGILAASDIARGVYYALDNGADVINMSFGGYARSLVEEDALATAYGTAVLVAAAGNDERVNLPCTFGANMYPASYNWVLGVMARVENPNHKGDYLAGFSNFDCMPGDAQEYELMAPGSQIMSTLPFEGYGAWSGTSMATPVVAGIAALARTKWNDKSVYSSRFIMGQIASTGPMLQAYTPQNAPPVFYHNADALSALTTVPQPELSYLEHWLFDTPDIDPINDNDGIVDAGETVELAIVIRNHWGKADNVQVTLEAQAEGAVQPDPYVEMLIGTVDYGAVGSFNNDDNGLIRDEHGAVIGVEHPFRFRVDPNTPNDHVIPFVLTMTADNGYDPSQPPVISESRFFLLVQRGRELPYVINEDMTLTKDDYWLVSDSVLISQGARVTVTEGTQIQFFSVDPEDPYSDQARPQIQVEGELIIEGTADEPVEIFTGLLYPAHPIQIRQMRGGNVDIQYGRISNPVLGNSMNIYTGSGDGAPINSIKNTYFSQNVHDCIKNYNENWKYCGQAPIINSYTVQSSIFRGLGMELHQSTLQTTLIDSSCIELSSPASDSVFLKNYKKYTDLGGESYSVSTVNPVQSFHEPSFLRFAFPTQYNGKTYVAVSRQAKPQTPLAYGKLPYLYAAKKMANLLGGHVVAINDQDENDFVRDYRNNILTELEFQDNYGDMDCGSVAHGGTQTCWELFRYGPTIGLVDLRKGGEYEWLSGEPVNYTNWATTPASAKFVSFSSSGTWHTMHYIYYPILLELPGTITEAQLENARQQIIEEKLYGNMTNNAVLNDWWDMNIEHWMRFYMRGGRDDIATLANNYWGTTSTTLIDAAIHDYYDDVNLGIIEYQPILTTAPETAYPFVVDVVVSNIDGPTQQVGVEEVTFTVTFNRDMDTDIQPSVSFGPDEPYTDFILPGDWTDARTWEGSFTMTPVTGDGYQYMRVVGAVAADDPWLVTGNDYGRFRFEVITSGTEAMNLQATGGPGYVDLWWTQDEFDVLAGYNLYRSTEQEGDYERVNNTVIPRGVTTFQDADVEPGATHYYHFTVVQTDLSETGRSNTATATPLDNVPPVITHTPITEAQEGFALTIRADVTDNIAVQSVTLFYRAAGTSVYSSRNMVKTTDDRYSATLESSLMIPPGIEYYIQASDGVNTTRSGNSGSPHWIRVGELTYHEVTVSAASGGTVTGGGTEIPINSEVTLTATPDQGFAFSHWTENGQIVRGAGATYTFRITEDRNLVAHFREIKALPGVLMLLLDDE
jgi:subtilisin family serine protease